MTTDNRTADLRAVAEQVVIEAAAWVRSRRIELSGASGSFTAAVRPKSSPTDPVTVVDTETEQMIRTRLAQLRPGEAVVARRAAQKRQIAARSAGWSTPSMAR